ncbi:MAG: hypothetical protein Q7K43_06820 [Candidatus Woesearchaeota archaeon]|nr:hypothetical protein [Candidatus Woesearchaeota archaeon]
MKERRRKKKERKEKKKTHDPDSFEASAEKVQEIHRLTACSNRFLRFQILFTQPITPRPGFEPGILNCDFGTRFKSNN